jgi:outer membrane protein assembly factor BamB
MRLLWTLTGFSMIVALSVAQAKTPVLTRSYEDGRTGSSLTETQLTPDIIAAKGLKRVKSLVIGDDPRIEAQPLYVPDLTTSDGAKHDVLFVASMGNHVFAFDVNKPQGNDLLWSTPLGEPFRPPVTSQPGQHRATSIDLYGINILWGVLSTPVIDPDTNTMYVVNWVAQANGKRALMLHRLGLKDGKETSQPAGGLPLQAALTDSQGKQVVDSGNKPVVLEPDQKQRAALLLTPASGPHKTLFVAMAGGEDPGSPHGWVLAFDVDTFTQTAAWVSTPKGFGGGIWQSSQGLAADAQGNVYAMTGNGGYKQTTKNGPIEADFNGTSDFAEAFVKLTYRRTGAGKGTLTLADWLIPFRDSDRDSLVQQPNYNYQDQDLGSAGPVVPPGLSILFGAGKDGLLYVLDRNKLGQKIGTGKNQAELFGALKAPPIYLTFTGLNVPNFGPKVDFPLGNPALFPNKTHHLHGSPVYWNGSAGPMIFAWGENESLREWKLDPVSGKVTFVARGAEVASAQYAAQFATENNGLGGMPGGMLSVSSNGTVPHTGIIWGTVPINGNANTDVVPGIARAYDATQLDPTPIDPTTPRLKLLWDSTRSGVTFNYAKFCPPVVADGKVFVPTYDGRVDVYVPNP